MPTRMRLVGVGRPDAPLGRAQLVLAQVALGHPVELLVVRHDQVGVAREPQVGGGHALGLEHVDLGEEHGRVDDHAVADDRRDVRVEDPARHELDLEDLAVDHDGVARVVATLVAHDEGRLLGEVVGEPTLALVTPLGADDHRARHRGLLLREADALAPGRPGRRCEGRDTCHVGERLVGASGPRSCGYPAPEPR